MWFNGPKKKDTSIFQRFFGAAWKSFVDEVLPARCFSFSLLGSFLFLKHHFAQQRLTPNLKEVVRFLRFRMFSSSPLSPASHQSTNFRERDTDD
jgi:hypothetical protein